MYQFVDTKHFLKYILEYNQKILTRVCTSENIFSNALWKYFLDIDFSTTHNSTTSSIRTNCYRKVRSTGPND